MGLAQAARSVVPARRGGEVRDTERDYPTRADGTIVVGLLADKGMPALIAQRLIDELPDVLTRQLSNRVEWQVHARCDPLLLDENGLIPMLDLADRQKPAHDWDLLVLLTDLPRRAGTQPIVSDYSTSRAVGLVSIPALGACRVPQRTRNLIVPCDRAPARREIRLGSRTAPAQPAWSTHRTAGGCARTDQAYSLR